MNTRCRALLVLTLSLLLSTSALAGGAADPDGTPFGVTTQSDAKGQKLDGVMVIEFTMVDSRFASEARVLARLRKGSELGSLFAVVPGPLDTDDVEAVQQAVFVVIEPRVLAKYFPEDCGAAGNLCPEVHVVLKDVDEVSTTDDGAAALFLVGNVVLSATEPSK
jgi:hypothetical protein